MSLGEKRRKRGREGFALGRKGRLEREWKRVGLFFFPSSPHDFFGGPDECVEHEKEDGFLMLLTLSHWPFSPLFFFHMASMDVIVRRHRLDACVSLHQHPVSFQWTLETKRRGWMKGGVFKQVRLWTIPSWLNPTFWSDSKDAFVLFKQLLKSFSFIPWKVVIREHPILFFAHLLHTMHERIKEDHLILSRFWMMSALLDRILHSASPSPSTVCLSEQAKMRWEPFTKWSSVS